MPFVKPFDASTGFDGLQEWKSAISDNVKKYFSKKNNLKEEALEHLLLGLDLGYPDQALLDFYNVFSTEKQNCLVSSQISYSDYYENPQPNFDYLPEHASEQSIVKITQSWGKLLEEFYNSHWHKSLTKDPMFRKIRMAEEKAHDNWFKRKRLYGEVP